MEDSKKFISFERLQQYHNQIKSALSNMDTVHQNKIDAVEEKIVDVQTWEEYPENLDSLDSLFTQLPSDSNVEPEDLAGVVTTEDTLVIPTNADEVIEDSNSTVATTNADVVTAISDKTFKNIIIG